MADRNPLHRQESEDMAIRAVLAPLAELWADVTSGPAEANATADTFTLDASFMVGDGTYLLEPQSRARPFSLLRGEKGWG